MAQARHTADMGEMKNAWSFHQEAPGKNMPWQS